MTEQTIKAMCEELGNNGALLMGAEWFVSHLWHSPDKPRDEKRPFLRPMRTMAGRRTDDKYLRMVLSRRYLTQFY